MQALRAMFDGPTVAETMVRYDNRSRGFDYIRIGLSIAVMVWHSFFLPTLLASKTTPFGFAVAMILPMFFALSGFLISGSLLRTTSITEFVTLRAVRIMPALAVEVLLSAFILGTLFTTLPLTAYFSDPLFARYMLNLIGDIHFLLPGVFATNPLHLINVSLWTVPYELICYLAIVVLWFAGAVPKRKGLLLLLVVAAQLAVPLRDLMSGDLIKPMNNNLPGRMFVLAFLWAIVLYFFAHRIRLRLWMAAAATLLCYLLIQTSITSYLIPLPAAYLTVYLGLTNPPKLPVLMSGDYSYGVYLYAAPLQQASVALFPDHREWWFNLATTLPLVVLFAAFSWHAVEKPVLSRRKAIVGVALRLQAVLVGFRPQTSKSRSAGSNAASPAAITRPSLR